VLEHDALGMFFYNQRAIFLMAAGVFLGVVAAAALVARDTRALVGTALLGAVWMLDVVATLLLHRSFRRELDTWAAEHRPVALPPIFDRYFLLDCALLAIVLAAGHQLALPFAGLAFLLCANIIVYAAYTFIGHASKLTKGSLLGLFVLILVLIIMKRTAATSMFADVMTVTPLAVMLLVTLLSVTMMSALATIEHRVTRKQLALLGEYQNTLLGPLTKAEASRDEPLYSEKVMRKRLRSVFKDLLHSDQDFWYRAISVWFITTHADRGEVILPGPYENTPEAAGVRDGVSIQEGFLVADDVVLLHSLKAQAKGDEQRWRFRIDLDAPAAIVPLRRGQQIGALLIYGDERCPPVPREDEQFLTSLASIIVTSWDQWHARRISAAHKELNGLFSLTDLDAVFRAAVQVLREYLFAAGCMIVFRADPSAPLMRVTAVAGFDDSIVGAEYAADVGQTGRCARDGETIRVDDVPSHRGEFDNELLARLEYAHGAKVSAWMAVPIGRPPRNFGVVKVVNRAEGSRWFTADDEALGENLALRLQVMIEKFLHVASANDAKLEAQRNADEARRAQAKAEAAAKERLQDLMTITHQMQGPLIGVVGALSAIDAGVVPRSDRDLIDHAQALVEDTITVGYGTFTTFALSAGRPTAFFENDVDAVVELRQLAKRLQRTNPRPEIQFAFRAERGFPTLRFDRRVFTTVLYSLIHNAIKYADDHTEVTLECSYERQTNEPAVKVKSNGAPIHPSERERIFERFVRGRAVERGQVYTGVGLGLWVARELMRAMGGNLTVELPVHQPRFSVFVVHFPKSAVGGASA